MSQPNAQEQFLLELINETRLNPLGNAARYISSYSPLHSSDSNIQSAFDYFGVNGSTLLSAFSALTPTQPLAWNSALSDAAAQHNNAMISADEQSHQVNGELGLASRIVAAGYNNWNLLGENIFAYGDSVLEGHAAFMVDWGQGPNGMQEPAGHRDNIMSPDFREIGIGITQENDNATSVGPLVITEDFGARGDIKALILGVAYNDSDHNVFYTVGEGLGNLTATLGAVSATSSASGGYTLETNNYGTQSIAFSGAGLASAVSVSLTLSQTSNIKVDVINGNTMKVSSSAVVTGPVSTLIGLGTAGLSLTITGT
jgi:hypothetical protein